MAKQKPTLAGPAASAVSGFGFLSLPSPTDAQAVAQFGDTIERISGAFAQKMDEAESDKQTLEARGRFLENYAKWQGEIAQDPDYQGYDKKFKEFMEGQQRDVVGTIRHRGARERAGKLLTQFGGSWAGQVQKQKWAAESQAIEDQGFLAIEQGVDIGGTEGTEQVDEGLGILRDNNFLTPDGAERLRRDKMAEMARLQKIRQAEIEEQVLRADIDAQVTRITALSVNERDAEVRKLTGYENVVRNEIKARVKEQTEADIEATQKTFTRSWVEGALTKPDVLAASLPSGLERKWLTDIKKQYDEGPSETSDAARLAINNANDAVAMGTLNNAGATEVFNQWKGEVRKEDRGGFLDDIEAEKDKHYSYRRQVGLAQLASAIKGPQNALGVYPEADQAAENQYTRAATQLNIELDKAKADDKPLTVEGLYTLTAQIANDIIRKAGPRRLIEDEDFIRQRFVPPLEEKLVNPDVQRFFQGAPATGDKTPVGDKPAELPANDNFVFEYLQPFEADPTEFTKVQLADIESVLWYALESRDKKAILDDILKHPTDTQMGKKWNARLKADSEK